MSVKHQSPTQPIKSPAKLKNEDDGPTTAAIPSTASPTILTATAPISNQVCYTFLDSYMTAEENVFMINRKKHSCWTTNRQ